MKIMLMTKEYYEVMEMFEKEYKKEGFRMDKEPKDLWSKNFVYQDDLLNKLFIAYQKGYAFGQWCYA